MLFVTNTVKYLTEKAIENTRGIVVGGETINTIKCACDQEVLEDQKRITIYDGVF